MVEEFRVEKLPTVFHRVTNDMTIGAIQVVI